MGKNRIPVLVAAICMAAFCHQLAFSQKPGFARLTINNMGYWIRADGYVRYAANGTQHIIYPEGTTTACATDAVLWGGYAYLDAAHTQRAPGELFRMGGQSRGTFAFQAGRIIGFGADAVPVNPADPDVRVYRIRRDYKRLTKPELTLEAAQVNQIGTIVVTDAHIAQLLAQYEKDWNEWPVQNGAPYIDRNRNGRYDKPPAFSDKFTVDSLIAGNYDEPGVSGIDPNSPADQVIWTVNNDLSPASNLFATLPDGLEDQQTFWAYKRTGALGQIVFRRAKIINKGGVDIGGGKKGALYLDSVYIALETDPDLGDFTEDVIGCDTLLSMGFIYNGVPRDRQYAAFGIPPPALGFDFLQGPRVPSPRDSAVFNIKRVYGWKNLPLTAFCYFSSGSPISDPPASVYEGALRFRKMFRGFIPGPSTSPDQQFAFPPGISPNSFPLSGDPVTGSGFVDGLGKEYSFAPGDRRFVLSSGPFTLAPGDTEELVIAYVGGLGSDRLSSVAVMKYNDRFAQNTYDGLFQVPNPPQAPDVKVAELDERVILEWGSDLVRVDDTESKVNNPGDYRFEGYNVYQFPIRSSSFSEAKRIATFDIPSDPTVVLDEQFDVKSGQILKIPVQFGTNSGVKRVFEFRRDYVRDIDKIYNGQEYYLAVTAYSCSHVPGYVPSFLESSPTTITVRPQVPFGKNLATVYGDTLAVTHTGASEGKAVAIVVDPTLGTGHTYEVGFEPSGDTATWKLTDKTKNQVILSGQRNQSGDDLVPIADGIIVKVIGPSFLGKAATFDPSANRWFTGATGSTGELATGGVYLGAKFLDRSSIPPTDYKTVEVRFVKKASFTDLDGDKIYDIGEPYSLPATGTQKAFMYAGLTPGGYEGFFDVPFTVWDVQDPAAPRQLNVIVNDPDKNKQWDLHNQVSSTVLPNGGDQRFNYIWIASSTYDPSGKAYDPGAGGTDWMSLAGTKPAYWGVWLGLRSATYEPYGAAVTMKLVPNFINTPLDKFTFIAPAVVADVSVQKASAEEVGVFPNPYYAYNPAETSRFLRFVTFHSLPPKVTIRIFNLSGESVQVIYKDNPSQFMTWDLTNSDSSPVGSGMYIAYIEMQMPSDGSIVTKFLKLAIIQEQEVLDVY